MPSRARRMSDWRRCRERARRRRFSDSVDSEGVVTIEEERVSGFSGGTELEDCFGG